MQSVSGVIICAAVRRFVNYDPAEQGGGGLYGICPFRDVGEIVKQKRLF